MFEFKTGRCPKCGKIAEIMQSNNAITPGICLNCLKKELDASKLEHADFFCRTYNIPLDPNRWVELYERCGDNVYYFYLKEFFESNTENLYYQKATKDLWKKADEE